ncbi:MAG: GNAT family N-acetyltransferase [Nocardioidaceae bacterium]
MARPVTVPVLTDGVVTLRAHTDDDVEDAYEMCTDPEFARWTSVPVPYTRDDAKRFSRELVPGGWQTGTSRGWAVEAADGETPRFAGNVDVRGTPIADIGFGLHPWARGQGIITRAVRLACAWAFDHGEVEVVHWRAQTGNVASRRVAWACGFTFHGTVPRLLEERGRVLDAWIATLLPGRNMQPATRWLEPTVLRGHHVVLRPLQESDAPRIVEACSDERTRQYLVALPDGYSTDDALAYVRSRLEAQSVGAAVTWAVVDPTSDRLLAAIEVADLNGLDPTAGEVGYWAHPGARGKAVVSEAAQIVVAHAFGSVATGGLGLRRLTLLAARSNTASRHVAQQAGFREAGLQIAAERLRDGSYDDQFTFELITPTAAGHR